VTSKRSLQRPPLRAGSPWGAGGFGVGAVHSGNAPPQAPLGSSVRRQLTRNLALALLLLLPVGALAQPALPPLRYSDVDRAPYSTIVTTEGTVDWINERLLFLDRDMGHVLGIEEIFDAVDGNWLFEKSVVHREASRRQAGP
jgi:hypothetical protein